jgi:hypothetical protein
MTSQFTRAERKRSKLRLGMMGASGSGKTKSSLLIAQGLGGRVVVIDTEHGSGDLYSHLFPYEIARIEAPFEPEKYVKLIKAAEVEKFDVIILDSITHAWAASGGLLERHDDLSKGEKNRYTAWREITPVHNAFIESMLQADLHVIATLRCKQDYILVEKSGKMVPEKVGLAPIQRDGMEYEFTTVFMLDNEHRAVATKDRTGLFDGRTPFIPTPAIGEELLVWLESGADPEVTSAAIYEELTLHLETIDNLPHLDNWIRKIAGKAPMLLAKHREGLNAAVVAKRAKIKAARNGTGVAGA